MTRSIPAKSACSILCVLLSAAFAGCGGSNGARADGAVLTGGSATGGGGVVNGGGVAGAGGTSASGGTLGTGGSATGGNANSDAGCAPGWTPCCGQCLSPAAGICAPCPVAGGGGGASGLGGGMGGVDAAIGPTGGTGGTGSGDGAKETGGATGSGGGTGIRDGGPVDAPASGGRASSGGATSGGGGANTGGTTSGGTGGAATGGAPTSGTGAGGSSGTGGSSSVDGGVVVACPADMPAAGSPCAGVTVQCSWGTEPRLECRTTGYCSKGVWTLQAGPAYCTAPTAAACYTDAATVSCQDPSLLCFYPPYTLCSCLACNCDTTCAIGPFTRPCNGQPIGSPVMTCDNPAGTGPDAAPCPSYIPNLGSACDTPNLACPPSACNQRIAVCTNGLWQWRYSTSGLCPVCASPDTPIATPDGDRRIADLQAGDLVYTVEGNAIVAVPILRTNRTPVANHHVIRVKLADGRSLEISAGHPTADGRTFGDLFAGTRLDGAAVEFVEVVPYTHPYTYDILPLSRSGSYFAAGLLIGSTLHR